MEIIKKVDCYLSLGSNLGNTQQNILNAIEAIATEEVLINTSQIYETLPIGFVSENLFANACVQIQTEKTAHDLLTFLKQLEVNIGRKEKSEENTYNDRIIDIDILLFGDEIIETTELSVPHKKYSERNFVIVPLCDIAEKLTDPQTKLTMRQYFFNLRSTELRIIVNNSKSEEQ